MLFNETAEISARDVLLAHPVRWMYYWLTQKSLKCGSWLRSSINLKPNPSSSFNLHALFKLIKHIFLFYKKVFIPFSITEIVNLGKWNANSQNSKRLHNIDLISSSLPINESNLYFQLANHSRICSINLEQCLCCRLLSIREIPKYLIWKIPSLTPNLQLRSSLGTKVAKEKNVFLLAGR